MFTLESFLNTLKQPENLVCIRKNGNEIFKGRVILFITKLNNNIYLKDKVKSIDVIEGNYILIELL